VAAHAAAHEHGSITLAGTAADDAAIARFIDSLRQVRAIRRVELKASSQFVAAGKETRRYEIVCGF
jgi:Tfp pilus assembly protein PilN